MAIWGDSPRTEREAALRDLADGRVRVVFSVDLFNEGVDVPAVDTVLMLRPTESPTLFLQQLGRGLRKAPGKTFCTVLDFVGTHRKEFRFDRRFRALLGGTRADVERQVQPIFRFLPAGCNMQLDGGVSLGVRAGGASSAPSCARLARSPCLNSSKAAASSSRTSTNGGHSWSEMRRAVDLPTAAGRTNRNGLAESCRTVAACRRRRKARRVCALLSGAAPSSELTTREQRLLRMLVSSLTTLGAAADMNEAIAQVWAHPQVRAELTEVLGLLANRVAYLDQPLGLLAEVPLRLHSRYTRAEIQAAFGIGTAAKPPPWQAGVLWNAPSQADLFVFTLDKSVGGFSPTTRYRDYAISPELIHWESPSQRQSRASPGRGITPSETAAQAQFSSRAYEQPIKRSGV